TPPGIAPANRRSRTHSATEPDSTLLSQPNALDCPGDIGARRRPWDAALLPVPSGAMPLAPRPGQNRQNDKRVSFGIQVWPFAGLLAFFWPSFVTRFRRRCYFHLSHAGSSARRQIIGQRVRRIRGQTPPSGNRGVIRSLDT